VLYSSVWVILTEERRLLTFHQEKKGWTYLFFLAKETS
jgi:hypothetical protein